MTKKTKAIIAKGIIGSINKQNELFNKNFLTRFLTKRAEKLGTRKNAM